MNLFNLLIIRHGKAEDHNSEDHQRNLTDRGRKQAATVGNQIKANGITPSLCVCSDANRTVQTLDHLGFNLPEEQIIYDPKVYTASTPTELVLCLESAAAKKKATPSTCLAIVGHNPTISSLSEHLTGEPTSFATGDAQLLRIEADSWNMALACMGQWSEHKWFSA